MHGHRLGIALAATGSALAIAACGGSGSKPRGSAGAGNSALALSQCMRTHGVPNFPDPSAGSGGEGFTVWLSQSSSTVTVDGIAFGGPIFTAAQKTCRFGPGGGGPPRISESQKQAMLASAECMRTHGVPNFPDPAFAGRPAKIKAPVVSSPAFQHAVEICRSRGR